MNHFAPRGALSVFLLGLALAAAAPGAPAASRKTSASRASRATAPKGLPGTLTWHSFDEGAQLAAQNHKALLVDVYTDWCGWCKRMDASTYKDSLVIAELNRNFVAVKLNAEKDDEISYKGEKTTPRRLASEVFGVTGYPCTVFLKADGEIISPLPGYREAPLFTLILRYIGTGAYEKQKWADFQKANS